MESVFLTEIYVQDENDLELIENTTNKDKELIIVERSDKDACINTECSLPRVGKHCICQLRFFLVRPYTYELLSAIQPFFEIIGISHLPFKELN